ncbi:MAG: hypothetical protein ACW98D_19860 [Promethearchaeota archaeon]
MLAENVLGLLSRRISDKKKEYKKSFGFKKPKDIDLIRRICELADDVLMTYETLRGKP